VDPREHFSPRKIVLSLQNCIGDDLLPRDDLARYARAGIQEDPMRNALIVSALVIIVFGQTFPTAAAPANSYAAVKNARAAALADCERQARAMQFGNRTVKRRNFIKDCMIDRMYYGGIN
jgi:hypothetical protein